MTSPLTRTYIEEIDEAIGGGIAKGAVFTIDYDTYSLGWMVGFQIVKNFILKHGAYGVIHNYLLPVPRLISRALSVGMDIKRSCLIIDIFGSKYRIPPTKDANVVQIANLNPETLIPKIEAIYEQKVFPQAENGKIIRMIYTIEGMATIFGEKITVKLLNSEIAYFGKKHAEHDIVTIILVNRDAVSKHLTAWIASISDNILVFKSEIIDHKVNETMTVVKSPFPEFEPVTYDYHYLQGEKRSLSFKKPDKWEHSSD